MPTGFKFRRMCSGAPDLFTSGETISVRVPIASKLGPPAIRTIARTKNYIHRRIRRGEA